MYLYRGVQSEFSILRHQNSQNQLLVPNGFANAHVTWSRSTDSPDESSTKIVRCGEEADTTTWMELNPMNITAQLFRKSMFQKNLISGINCSVKRQQISQVHFKNRLRLIGTFDTQNQDSAENKYLIGTTAQKKSHYSLI